MIYKDELAKFDTDELPCERPEPCMNCGDYYVNHDGWRCPTSGSECTYYTDLYADERYQTQIMVMSKKSVKEIVNEKPVVLAQAVVVEPKVDLSDWRTWAHNRPGDCPCGIARTVCDYHR